MNKSEVGFWVNVGELQKVRLIIQRHPHFRRAIPFEAGEWYENEERDKVIIRETHHPRGESVVRASLGAEPLVADELGRKGI